VVVSGSRAILIELAPALALLARVSTVWAEQLFAGLVRHTKQLHDFGYEQPVFRDDVSTCSGAFLISFSECRLQLTSPEMESVVSDAQQDGISSHGDVHTGHEHHSAPPGAVPTGLSELLGETRPTADCFPASLQVAPEGLGYES